MSMSLAAFLSIFDNNIIAAKKLSKIVDLLLGGKVNELEIVVDGCIPAFLDTNFELNHYIDYVQEYLKHDIDYQRTYQDRRAPPW